MRIYDGYVRCAIACETKTGNCKPTKGEKGPPVLDSSTLQTIYINTAQNKMTMCIFSTRFINSSMVPSRSMLHRSFSKLSFVTFVGSQELRVDNKSIIIIEAKQAHLILVTLPYLLTFSFLK